MDKDVVINEKKRVNISKRLKDLGEVTAAAAIEAGFAMQTVGK